MVVVCWVLFPNMSSNYNVKGLKNLRGLVSTFIINTTVLLFTSKISCKIISILEAKTFSTILDYKSKAISRSVYFLPAVKSLASWAM